MKIFRIRHTYFIFLGVRLFVRKKNLGVRLFVRKKNLGVRLFVRKKNLGVRVRPSVRPSVIR
jgi:hypothetical protein